MVDAEMKCLKLFELAKPYLRKNELGVEHTERVLRFAKKRFRVPDKDKELVYSAIVLHDIGGSTVEEQRVKGPKIAVKLMRKLKYPERLAREICEMIKFHHDRLENPSRAFKILYDCDQLAKFSREEFLYYDSREGFSWDDVLNGMYSKKARRIAKTELAKRVRGL